MNAEQRSAEADLSRPDLRYLVVPVPLMSNGAAASDCSELPTATRKSSIDAAAFAGSSAPSSFFTITATAIGVQVSDGDGCNDCKQAYTNLDTLNH